MTPPAPPAIRSPRVLAVDWSGARTGAGRSMWAAEATGRSLGRLVTGLDRPAMIRRLLDEAARDPHLVVGLDFAFSAPAWFLEREGCGGAADFWALVARRGEEWLAACPPPFWGRNGRHRSAVPQEFRRTERWCAAQGFRPKSVFQVNFPGAVGTGSLRGMPFLATLRQEGFAVWPFERPAFPLVVEIFPRLLTGRVVKNDPLARAAYLEGLAAFPADVRPVVDASAAARMAASEDAFDAGISALGMAANADGFAALAAAPDAVGVLEGEIWAPGPARSWVEGAAGR